MFMEPRGEEPRTWTLQTWVSEDRRKVQKMHDLVAQWMKPQGLAINKRLKEFLLSIGERRENPTP